MKRKVQLIIAFCFFSFNVQSQSNNIDEQLKFDKEFVVGSIKLVCGSLNQDNTSTFNCYIKNENVYCDIDFYLNTMYNSKFAYETDKKLDKDSREIIYNRVIMQMKNGDVIKTIKDSKIINNAMLFFKIRFNTTDGTVLKYNYFITIDSLTKISEYLNKDDFNNNLHLADGI